MTQNFKKQKTNKYIEENVFYIVEKVGNHVVLLLFLSDSAMNCNQLL